MKISLPRKRVILGIHRWLGILSAIFLLVLALTGLALNHAEPLGLHRVRISSPMLLGLYGMAPAGAIHTYRIYESNTISWLDGELYFGDRPVGRTGRPVGILEGPEMALVATPESLVYLSREGELVEILDQAALPFGEIQGVGRGAGDVPVIHAADGMFALDSAWLKLARYDGKSVVAELEPAQLSEAERQEIVTAYQGEGLSLYRVLLDLHSGRILGWGGRTAMDLTAVAILLLVSSGIGGWLRKSRKA